jgi:AcrR family transcriptional regulator
MRTDGSGLTSPAKRDKSTKRAAAAARTTAAKRGMVGRPTRAEKAAGRRDAIVAAALEEFAQRGYAATRLDDIARRAGVAKGTIYLHFKDKEALFLELLRAELGSRVSRLDGPLPDSVPTRAIIEAFVQMFLREVLPTRRADIIRLVMTEGPNLPALAEFYYREVVERGIGAMTKLMERAAARGELRHPGLAKFPQLVVAPALVAVMWNALFGKISPLDTEAMLRTHIDLIFGEGRPA